MAISIEAYRDDRGHVHDTPAEAIVADIAAALGRVGDEGGLTNGVAKLIFEKRPQIEKAFADYDRLMSRRSEITDPEIASPEITAPDITGPQIVTPDHIGTEDAGNSPVRQLAVQGG